MFDKKTGPSEAAKKFFKTRWPANKAQDIGKNVSIDDCIMNAFDEGVNHINSFYENWIDKPVAYKACEGCLQDLYNIGSSINLSGNFQQFWEGFQSGILWIKKKSEWHNLMEDPKDVPNNDCAEVFVKYRMSTTNPIPENDCDYTVGFYDTNGKWVLKSFSWDRPDGDKDNMYGYEVLAWKEIN